MEKNNILKLENSVTINASQTVPGYPAHGVVIEGTTAHFQQTSDYNANAAFQFTGLKQMNQPGTIHLKWTNLTTPGYNSNLGLYNYSTNQFDYYLAYGVSSLQVNSLENYINDSGELQVVVWLNIATGILNSLQLNY